MEAILYGGDLDGKVIDTDLVVVVFFYAPNTPARWGVEEPDAEVRIRSLRYKRTADLDSQGRVVYRVMREGISCV